MERVTSMKKKLGRRLTLARRIYQDRWGISVVVSIGEYYKEHRFDLETDLEELKSFQRHEEAKVHDQMGKPTAVKKGTLASDVPAFLRTVPEGSTRDEFEDLLYCWIDAPVPGMVGVTFGMLRREKIKRQQLETQLAIWGSKPFGQDGTGYAASTLNHRIRALRAVYRVLDADDEDAPDPTAKIKKRRESKAEPRDIPVPVVQLLLDNMPDRGRGLKGQKRSTVSETKIRCRVIAWTGMPHKQLERLRERDVRFDTAEVYRTPRRKGKGAKGGWMKVIPPALEALRDYAAANLWGRPFSRSSIRASWRRTIARTLKQAADHARETGDTTLIDLVRQCLPENCRPYDLRHAFLSEAYRRSGDLRAVAELGQHSNLQTTRRYTEGAVSERADAAVAAMSERWTSARPEALPFANQAPAAQKKRRA
jgi:integrase